ncbi:MAG: hypothetical protein ACODAJ_14950, partial [Planctomycetota bacterium]
MKPLAIVVAVLALVPVAWGAEKAERGRMQAVIVEKGPPVDGTLQSALWEKCPPLPLGQCTSAKPGPLETTARVLFGPARLYVAFE